MSRKWYEGLGTGAEYGKWYPSQAEKKPSKKYKVGDTINRGGRNWNVVGFDKDGEPLVEESK